MGVLEKYGFKMMGEKSTPRGKIGAYDVRITVSDKNKRATFTFNDGISEKITKTSRISIGIKGNVMGFEDGSCNEHSYKVSVKGTNGHRYMTISGEGYKDYADFVGSYSLRYEKTKGSEGFYYIIGAFNHE